MGRAELSPSMSVRSEGDRKERERVRQTVCPGVDGRWWVVSRVLYVCRCKGIKQCQGGTKSELEMRVPDEQLCRDPYRHLPSARTCDGGNRAQHHIGSRAPFSTSQRPNEMHFFWFFCFFAGNEHKFRTRLPHPHLYIHIL